MAERKSELIDVTMHVHPPGTSLAIRASNDGDDKNAVWLPRSQIEMEPTSNPNIFEITMPTWLARDKGLI